MTKKRRQNDKGTDKGEAFFFTQMGKAKLKCLKENQHQGSDDDNEEAGIEFAKKLNILLTQIKNLFL